MTMPKIKTLLGSPSEYKARVEARVEVEVKV